MTLSSLLTINSVVALLFGFGFVLAPETLMSFYGATLNDAGILIGRLFGAALIGYASLAWFARNAENSGARRAIVLAYFVGFAIGFGVSLSGQLSGVLNALGWSTVVIYLLFTLGYGYFQFSKPSTQ